ncbi:MAG TPA: DNA photolyase [Thermoanaerobaculia bacterium]|jgi:spore photoproduct lyase
MIGTVYVEREIAGHPRTAAILRRFPRATRVPCERYGEVFNRRAQSFRLQKRRPALILARKHARHVLATPAGYGVGGRRNFYFSHMLNCLYDCRYCFLQGMYRSAHYVVFVNYEDFFDAIERTAGDGDDAFFFSGYDCDSLAFEAVTGFVGDCLPLFRRLPRAWLELRTKSARVEPLRAAEPLPNCVVAWSFTPPEVSAALEHQVPSVERRLRAMAQLQGVGWPLGLRFDPLVYTPDYREQYRRLFAAVFATVGGAGVHSVSLGPFRLPTGFFRRLERLYPDEPLFAGAFADHGGTVSYPHGLEAEMIAFCSEEVLRYVPREVFFPCGDRS